MVLLRSHEVTKLQSHKVTSLLFPKRKELLLLFLKGIFNSDVTIKREAERLDRHHCQREARSWLSRGGGKHKAEGTQCGRHKAQGGMEWNECDDTVNARLVKARRKAQGGRRKAEGE